MSGGCRGAMNTDTRLRWQPLALCGPGGCGGVGLPGRGTRCTRHSRTAGRIAARTAGCQCSIALQNRERRRRRLSPLSSRQAPVYIEDAVAVVAWTFRNNFATSDTWHTVRTTIASSVADTTSAHLDGVLLLNSRFADRQPSNDDNWFGISAIDNGVLAPAIPG